MAIATLAALAERGTSIPSWAEQTLILPTGAGPRPYRAARTPYWSHWLRLFAGRVAEAAPVVDQITLVTGAQVGKTLGLLAPAFAWTVAVWPQDVAIYLPSHDALKDFVKHKLTSVFRLSPRMAPLLPGDLDEDGRKVGAKAWPLPRCTGYFLHGAVALDLRRRDLPVILSDEFDALPLDVDGEGSPVELMRARQTTFPHTRMLLQITTPTTVDGLGWQQLCAGTHERLLVACLGCGAHDYLDDRHLVAVSDDLHLDQLQTDDAAHWRCPRCGRDHTSDERDRLVAAACAAPLWTAAGGWVPGHWAPDQDGGPGTWTPDATVDAAGRITAVTAPAHRRHRSGWMNSLYSSSVTLGQYLAEMLAAERGDEGTRKAFCNNRRALPYHPKVQAVTADTLPAVVRIADGYQLGQLPWQADRVVIGCDQQGDYAEKSWFPYIVRAWRGADSWLLDTGREDGFGGLTRLMARQWPVGGVPRSADAIALDSANGPMQRTLRQWCAQDPAHRFSLIGSGSMSPGQPYAFFDADTPQRRLSLQGLPRGYVINSTWWADQVWSLMQTEPDGQERQRPRWELPPDAPRFYLDSLQANERIVEPVTVRGRREVRTRWQPKAITLPTGEVRILHQDHWWDAEKLALALVSILGWNAPPAPTPATADDLLAAYGGAARSRHGF
jgi:phage terminase large subunit GpA-like protein